MDNPELRATLEQLHGQLEQMQVVDEESRQLLQHLKNDIQAVLKEPNASAQASLRMRLDAAMDQFEDTHSDLTLTIKQLLDHLAQV